MSDTKIYADGVKRLLDFCISLLAIIVLSPLLLVLTVLGAVSMKGNPFFFQERPGWHEKVFRMVKFRTMDNPTLHGDEQKWVDEAIRTNWVSTVGANINEVERQVAEKVGRKYAVALSSGTAALHLAIKLCGEKLYGQPMASHGSLEGKRVFASDMTFDATVNPICYEGGIPVFIDTEYDTWNMDP